MTKKQRKYDFTNVSYECTEEMRSGKNKAITYGVHGLLTDGEHHKQWCIEKMLIALGVNLEILREELQEDDYDWEDGIAP